MKGSAPGLSIRARLILLVVAAVLPLFLFSAALLQRSYSSSAALIEDTAMGNVRRFSLAIDAQIGRAQAVVMALGEMPIAEAADLQGFEDMATRALAANGLDGVVMLARADGSKVAHTLSLPGQALPPLNDRAGLQRLFATGRSQTSGVYTGQITHESQVAVHVPVWRNGQIRFDAVLALSVRSINQTLQVQTMPEGWFAAVADREGRTIARTLGGPAEIGQPISAGLATLAAGAEEGFGPVTSREGYPVYAAFTHTPLTGWLVVAGVPESTVRGPRLRSIAILAGGAAVLLLASIALAWMIGRHIARPVHALADQAARLGRNELPDAQATRGVAEAEAAGQALHEAGLLLAARAAEREAALRQAEESEARLLLAQEAGQIGAWETDCATGQRSWSPQQYVLYGVDPAADPPHGPAWAALIHPEDRSRVLATVARAYGAPLSYQHEFRIVPPGRAVRWLRSAGRSVFRDGKPSRLLGVTLDATERHESEQRLRDGAARLEAEVAARTGELAESERRFRTYFEHSADALLVVRAGADGRFTYETLNPAGERLTGYRHVDIAGQTPDKVLLPETAASVLATYRQVVADGAPLRLEQSLALPTGLLDLETVLVPVRDTAGGPVVRIISGQRDLTEQRRLEARLSHSQRMEAVGQLTGGVAHDFNNLLTVVVGNLSLLRRRLGDDERALRYLTSVEQAAERGAKLTASLLAFSRRQTLQVAPLDVGALLTESTTLLRRGLDQAVELELDITPGLPLATADAAQLEAAVLNLVINARDAMQDAAQGGLVQIQVRPAVLREAELEGNDEAKPGRFVVIAVQDNGAGMSAETRARAFEPFFTTKEVGRGTGLGLSQVFGFVRQLAGHVTLDSTPGHGTRVALFLPVAEAARPQPAEHDPRLQSMPADAVVLVVEDDDGIRDVTAEVLREAGLTVLTAASGPAALDILRAGTHVDAVFSDVVMPGGATGVDLARAARALRPALSVLLTSGYGGPALSRYGADGEYEVLAKPYTRTALLERLGRMLAGPSPVSPGGAVSSDGSGHTPAVPSPG